ncbi:HDOD domain-containing protein [Idiomarina xiamenensis]|uniref:HD superfamily hydrolase n=1 Tax=Idiomarina xiamenensis 10-D-4 TaxID=740709 RepID=K2K9N8_9GAMM|nr:HDOD domain-containing protein [Idiomarina xiamenensis]EKE84518.1 HD superfamily hydrolase [Idiomarina xiamenensis 10-D-4]
MYQFFSVSTEGGSRDPAIKLEKRFINYLISFPFARQQREGGNDDEDKVQQRRALLDVERISHQERERKRHARQRYVERISEELHSEVHRRVLLAIDDPESIRTKVVPMPENLPALLDTVSLRAASMAKIEALACDLDWFRDGLVRVVNNPPFVNRRKDKQMRLENLRVAMSFVGSENLRVLTPAFALQNWLPPATQPFTLFRRKVWEHSLQTAILSQAVAEQMSLRDPVLAYTMGMFHELGKIALTKLYLRIFDEVQREQALATINDHSPDRHNAIQKLIPDEQFLRDLMLALDKRVSYLTVQGWHLERLPISEHLLSYTQNQHIDDMSNYAKALAQANAYSEYRMLKQVDLVDKEDAAQLFKRYQISAEQISQLKHVNLKRPRMVSVDD